MEAIKKVNSFVKQFVAQITGDDSTVQAEKTFRQADSALKTQIASLKGDVITKEDAVTDAVEAQSKARINNGKPITDRNQYVTNLVQAKNNVTISEEALASHNAKISFLEAELTLLSNDS